MSVGGGESGYRPPPLTLVYGEGGGEGGGEPWRREGVRARQACHGGYKGGRGGGPFGGGNGCRAVGDLVGDAWTAHAGAIALGIRSSVDEGLHVVVQSVVTIHRLRPRNTGSDPDAGWNSRWGCPEPLQQKRIEHPLIGTEP